MGLEQYLMILLGREITNAEFTSAFVTNLAEELS